MTKGAEVVAAPCVRRHRWNDAESKHIPAREAPDGNDRIEKTCTHCGLVKITVHSPGGLFCRREWRTIKGERLLGRPTPPCLTGEI